MRRDGGIGVEPNIAAYPDIALKPQLVHRLRDLACADPGCAWCRERHDARKELKRWFGFNEFRPEPEDDDGRPMQQATRMPATR